MTPPGRRARWAAGEDVTVRVGAADLVESDVHGYYVESGVVVHGVGVGLDYPGVVPGFGLGESLDGEGGAGGIVFDAEYSGLGETLYIVCDAVPCPGANIQDVDVHGRRVISIHDLGEDSVGDDGVVGLGHVLQGFEEPGVVLTSGPYAAGGQVVGESVEVLVEGGVELNPASEERGGRWDSGGGSPCGERVGSPRPRPSPTSRRRRRRGTRCPRSGVRSRGSRRG